MDFPPGVLGILSGELSRYAGCAQSLLGLHLPPGTICTWVTGSWISTAINRMIRSMPPAAAWIAILADDHRYPPDLIVRLLSHQVDVVAPLCPLRYPPYNPSMFHGEPGHYHPYTWAELQGQTGLVPVASMGGPGVVLQRRVLDAIGDPWFETMPGERETPKEDLWFFQKCLKAGFQPHVDLDCSITHYFPGELCPVRDTAGNYRLEVRYDTQRLGILGPGPRKGSPIADYHAYA